MSQSISEPTIGEYDAINFDGLERRANYRTIAYREDILHILEHKDAAAIIYQIISRWQTEIKRPQILKEIERRKQTKQPPLTAQEVENMMWVYMSYNDFVRESGGAVAYNTIIRMMHYLVNTKKVVEQRENHDPRYPDYEYRINKDTVKELLKALPTEPAFSPKVPKKKEKSTQEGTPPDDSTQMGTESTQEGIATTQMGTEVYPNGGTSHITHNYTHNYNTEEQERESPPNTLDTHTIVSSDTARSQFSLIEAIFFLRKHSYTIEPFAQRKDVFVLQYPSGKEVHISAENIITEANAVALGEAFDTAHAEYPLITFADCLGYLQEQGVAPRGEDAVEVMTQARTLYARRHPRYEYRARPGLSEHPDDQLPSKREQVFTDEPQGDDHDTHRVPDVSHPGHSASSFPAASSGHPQGASPRAAHPSHSSADVRAMGSGTAASEGECPGANHEGVVGEAPAETLAQQTPTTSMPAQLLSPSPRAEQAALGARSKGKKAAATPDKPEFLPEGEALYRDWCSLFHVTIPKTKAIILAANELAEPITFWSEQKLGIPKAEVLKRIMNWLYKNNPNYYGEGRGVKLYDIHRDFEEWQSAAERKLAKDALKVVVPPAEDKSRMFNMTPIILGSSRTKRQGGLHGKAVTATH